MIDELTFNMVLRSSSNVPFKLRRSSFMLTFWDYQIGKIGAYIYGHRNYIALFQDKYVKAPSALIRKNGFWKLKPMEANKHVTLKMQFLANDHYKTMLNGTTKHRESVSR